MSNPDGRHLPKGTPLVARLLYHSEPVDNGCWDWSAKREKAGYGVIKVNGKQCRASRVSCQLAHGSPPDGKPFALHTCDNSPCINPDHLYWGDQPDNMRDRIERGRWRGGRPRLRPCVGHEFTPRSNGSCKHCRRDYRLS